MDAQTSLHSQNFFKAEKTLKIKEIAFKDSEKDNSIATSLTNDCHEQPLFVIVTTRSDDWEVPNVEIPIRKYIKK